MNRIKIEGVIVPMLTAFDPRGELNIEATRNFVKFLIERGAHGLFPAGTTGEMPLLSLEERYRLAETVVEAADEQIPVIIHTGAASTAETKRLTYHAQAIGASAAAVITPYYYRYNDEALFKHLGAVASHTPDFPIYLYNFPTLTGNRLTFDLICRLAERYPNIVGLKDSSGSLETLVACGKLRNGAFNTAIGTDGLILAGVAMGLDASVSGHANVLPELVVALYYAAASGDVIFARELQTQLNHARQILGDGGDLSLFKGTLARRGINMGEARAPLPQASAEKIERCWQALNALELRLLPG